MASFNIDTSHNPHRYSFNVPEAFRQFKQTLEALVHPNGSCTNPRASIIMALADCPIFTGEIDSGVLEIYEHTDKSLISIVCKCNCAKHSCLETFNEFPDVFIPFQNSPNDGDLAIDIKLPSITTLE